MKFSNKGENEMSKIRNKIITVSGDPRSGKSTIIKYLVKIFENMGFRVHVLESGAKFREISQRRYLEKYPDRVDAKQSDIQADESFAEERRQIDEEVDQWLRDLKKIINCKDTPNDIYIVDSRLAWFFFGEEEQDGEEESFDMRITVDDEIEAGRRALNDKSKGPNDLYDKLTDAVEHTKKRKEAERKRYGERGINIGNPKNFNYNKDTSHVKIEELEKLAQEIVVEVLSYWRKRETRPIYEGR